MFDGKVIITFQGNGIGQHGQHIIQPRDWKVSLDRELVENMAIHNHMSRLIFVGNSDVGTAQGLIFFATRIFLIKLSTCIFRLVGLLGSSYNKAN